MCWLFIQVHWYSFVVWFSFYGRYFYPWRIVCNHHQGLLAWNNIGSSIMLLILIFSIFHNKNYQTPRLLQAAYLLIIPNWKINCIHISQPIRPNKLRKMSLNSNKATWIVDVFYCNGKWSSFPDFAFDRSGQTGMTCESIRFYIATFNSICKLLSSTISRAPSKKTHNSYNNDPV